MAEGVARALVMRYTNTNIENALMDILLLKKGGFFHKAPSLRREAAKFEQEPR